MGWARGLLVVMLALVRPAAATVLPSGFVETVLTDQLASATAAAIAPDGRIFVAEQNGTVRVLKGGVLLDAPFAQVAADDFGERGLLGITLHPDFPSPPYVYLYYSALGLGANRLSRFTAGGDVAAGSEEVLVELPSFNLADIHMGGALHFGPDRMLYVAVGDHTRSVEAQWTTSVVGKILRVDENGAIPTDNPFYATSTGLARAIWALGLRNPFTFAFHPTSGRLFIDDVGQASWEEIDDGMVGANYGWPESEGATDDPRFVTPLYTYSHLTPFNLGGGCAISGGTFYAPPVATFPPDWVGGYFFADFCARWIRWFDPAVTPASPIFFATGLTGRPADLDVGPDGSLYVLGRLGDPPREDDTAMVSRITYTGTRAPQITVQPASQTIFVGDPVTFEVGATDADSFRWQRDGADIPGETGTSYTIPAVAPGDDGAVFRAIATNGYGSTSSDGAFLTVTADQAPTATIDVQAPRPLYEAGDHITFSGTASDPEDGPLPPEAFTWTVNFHHDTHFHPFLPATTGVTSGDFTVPISGETSPNVWFRINLRVVDSGGRSFTTSAEIHPEIGTLTLATSPSGLRVDLDGQPHTSPFVADGVVGLQRLVSTVQVQNPAGVAYNFTGWSDGRSRQHQIVFPAGDTTTLTANFVPLPTTTTSTSTSTTTSSSTTSSPDTTTTGPVATTVTTTTEPATTSTSAPTSTTLPPSSTTSSSTTSSTSTSSSSSSTTSSSSTSTSTSSSTTSSSSTSTSSTTSSTSTTTSSSTSSSTSTAATTTAPTPTTQPPPSCEEPCDDGDPCTASACVDGVCTHVPLDGIAAAACVCDRRPPAACGDSPLAGGVRKRLGRACRALVRAETVTAPEVRLGLLRLALLRWREAAQQVRYSGSTGRITPACVRALEAQLGEARSRAKSARRELAAP